MRKIVQVVISLESAGRAGLRLHRAFKEAGFSSNMNSLQHSLHENDSIQFLNGGNRLLSKLDGKIQSYLTKSSAKERGMFSYPVLSADISIRKEILEADVIYLYWILGGMLNLNVIEKLAQLGKPLFVVLYDMWMITGGCHHSFSCEKFKSECSACPVFPEGARWDLANSLFKKKHRIFSKYDNLYFVSPSKWMADCAKQSSLTKNKPVFIFQIF